MKEPSAEFIATLNDKIAESTSWSPLVSGGANYRTFEFVQVSSNRIEFRPSLSDKIFSLLCLLVGLGCCGGGIYLLMTSENSFSVPGLLLIPFGLFLIVAGIVQVFFKSVLRVFDRDASLFWIGKQPHDASDRADNNNSVPLERIHAIQLLRERISTPQTKYSSFEMNLILIDGSRINVVDHGDLNSILDKAVRLAEFLGVPVWDATNESIV